MHRSQTSPNIVNYQSQLTSMPRSFATPSLPYIQTKTFLVGIFTVSDHVDHNTYRPSMDRLVHYPLGDVCSVLEQYTPRP